jgi:hypothetical protein
MGTNADYGKEDRCQVGIGDCLPASVHRGHPQESVHPLQLTR